MSKNKACFDASFNVSQNSFKANFKTDQFKSTFQSVIAGGGGVGFKIMYYNTPDDFPVTGSQQAFYVATDTYDVYLWDTIDEQYVSIGLDEEDRTKLESIEYGAQVNTVTGVKGDAEEEYRVGDINITQADIGLSNVDNTADMDKPVSTATQEAIENATKTYIHTQMVASDVWEINHNLNKFPSIDVIDSGGTMVVGECEYIDSNNVRVVFIGAFSGKAYLN